MINFKTSVVKQTETQGTIVLEPLERGFGHTVGNVLRRVLLSALPGAAFSFVKIEGVSHQFATLPGIMEDVVEIILNLKKVRMRLYSDKPVKMTLKASGKKEVKAGDIDTLGTGEIVNPDLHLATLTTPSAKLNVELTAEKGVGFIGADEKKTDVIGELPIDSIFTPVIGVKYIVEPTRVGRSANFDKLILEITTDGTIKPLEAVLESARILAAYFKQIFDPTVDEEILPEKSPLAEDTLSLSIEELDLPVRITNALKAIEIETVGQLVAATKSQLLKAKNLGNQSVSLIEEKLTERGLTLREA